MAKTPPFRTLLRLDEPSLVGAQWWQDMVASAAPVDREGRRKLLRWALGGVAVAGGVGFVAWLARDEEPAERVEPRDALRLQQEHGWSAGSPGSPLDFEGAQAAPADRSSLDRLAADLAPRQAALRPFFVPTLFEALGARPTAGTPLEATRSLRDELRPVLTYGMRVAYSRGRALGSLLVGAPPGKAVVVDLVGPDSVAFAAGLAGQAEPVFLFDNWPHPRGVVRSHEVLGAAWALQRPLVEVARTRPEKAPPAFVLDRSRLAHYLDSSDRFDNRYVARLPSAEALRKLGISEVLYVSPPVTPQQELDDLNAEFLGWGQAGVKVRLVRASDFDRPRLDPGAAATTPTPAPAGPYDAGEFYYGASYDAHYALWLHYEWGAPPRRVRVIPTFIFYPGWTYRVVSRPTLFVAGGRRPASMGRVYVSASRATGALTRIGSRSGSFGRAGSVGG